MAKQQNTTTWQQAVTSTYKTARRIAIAAVGATVVLVGLAMMVLPGPAFVVIPAGLAILGLEFAWARRWLRNIRASAAQSLGLLSDGAAKPEPTSDASNEYRSG
jgi:uncharacterized protein (TIGR02611 family)